MPVKATGPLNEHGRRLIDNADRDYAPYRVKRISPTMEAFAEFLTELYGDLSDIPVHRLVYLAVTLHKDFQGGTWWNARKHGVRPGSRFNDGDKPGPKPGNATPGPVARPLPEAKPRRKRRDRDDDIPSPY